MITSDDFRNSLAKSKLEVWTNFCSAGANNRNLTKSQVCYKVGSSPSQIDKIRDEYQLDSPYSKYTEKKRHVDPESKMITADKARITRQLNKLPKQKSEELKTNPSQEQEINQRYELKMRDLIKQRDSVSMDSTPSDSFPSKSRTYKKKEKINKLEMGTGIEPLVRGLCPIEPLVRELCPIECPLPLETKSQLIARLKAELEAAELDDDEKDEVSTNISSLKLTPDERQDKITQRLIDRLVNKSIDK